MSLQKKLFFTNVSKYGSNGTPDQEATDWFRGGCPSSVHRILTASSYTHEEC